MADPHLIVNGKEYPIPTDFNMGELADIEAITGQGYDIAKPGIRGNLAIVYIAVRRVDSTVTIDDIRALDPDDFEFKGDTEAPLSAAEPDSEPSENTSSGNSDGSTGSNSSPGKPPERYWRPDLGDQCHVGIGDIARMTPAQLMMCVDYMEKRRG